MSVMVKNKTNKNYKRSQKGRSMVEMLGVLAIVGVLSVGGVYGYGVAMKKHKANELLHQASMLATTVSAQIDSLGGDLPETITDFGSTNYGKFSTSVTQTEDKKKFVLTIENVDSAVCDQLKKGGMVQGVECVDSATSGKKDAQITYYKNLATTEAEGEKSPTGKSEKIDPCESVTCESGQECIGGACATVTPHTVNGCSKNSDCDEWCKGKGDGEKCYCAIDANTTRNDSACYNNFTGHCVVATSPSDDADEYTVSDYGMTWWSAVNFCKAHNALLVSLADLGITGGYQDDGYCTGSECTGTVDWSDLQKKIGTDGYWTTDAVSCDEYYSCTAGTNNNSCHALFVYLSSDTVGYNSRYYSDIYCYALCE